MSSHTATVPATFTYSKYRHGGWYVSEVRYPSGAVGCVSRNYEDGKWRIVCGDHAETFKTRDDAARAEFALVEAQRAAPAIVAQPVQQAQANASAPNDATAWARMYELGRDVEDGDLTYSSADVMDECIGRALAAGWQFDRSAYGTGDWPWFLAMGFDDGRCVQRDGAWRLYVETAAEALAEAGEADTVAFIVAGGEDDASEGEWAAQPVQPAQADASAFVTLGEAVAPVVARLMAMPVQQAQGKGPNVMPYLLDRLAWADSALIATPKDSPVWAARFDRREAYKARVVAADPVAYVRAYPSHAFAYRHLLPADMVARIEAAETDADMRAAIAPRLTVS